MIPHLFLLMLLLKFMLLDHRTSPVSQPQYGIPMHYFSSQTVTLTNVTGAQPTYTDPIMSIPSSANLSRTNELAIPRTH